MAALWLRSRQASVPDIPPTIRSDSEVLDWFATVVLIDREAWVAEYRGVIVSLLVLEPGWIDQLYVDPEHAGRGLGSRLVDVAKSRHPAGLDLWTFMSNARARTFYEGHGFEPVAATDGDNEEGVPDILYRWTAGSR
jgi:GNAT superfamily N-acetyltransferase